MNANNYLQLLQAEHQESPNIIKEDLEYRQNRYEYISNKLNDPSLLDTFSQFQNKTDNDYINEAIFTPLLNSLPSKVREKISSIPIGTLPILEVNAHAIKVPNDEGKIIIIDRGLMMTLSTFSEAHIISSYILNTQKIESKNEFIFNAYKNILDHYLRNKNLTPLEIPEMPYNFYAHSSLLTIGMESYVCAHEIAHIYCGHLNDDKTIHVNLSNKENTSIEFYQKSKFQEYQADKLAWLWHQKFIRNEFLTSGEKIKSLWLSAPFYLFILFAMLEKNIGIPKKYSTHPSARLRMENLIENTYANAKRSLTFSPLKFPTAFRMLIDTVPNLENWQDE